MKKIILLIAIISLTLTSGFAQKPKSTSKAGTIGFGPLVKTGGVQIPENSFQMNVGGGLFGNYSLNKYLKVHGEIAYEYRFAALTYSWQYIEVPALVSFQLGSGFVGAGLKYSQCIIHPDYVVGGPGSNYSYVSAIVEFSYQSAQSMFGNNIFMSLLAGFGGYKTALRLGYALTPYSYNLMNGLGEVTNYKSHPFFAEAVLRYDLGSLFKF